MAVPLEKRPRFRAAWAASADIYLDKDPDGNDFLPPERLQYVARTAGGKVFANICKESSGDECTIDYDGTRWTNACAVRMSYILNHSGVLIPGKPETVSGSGGLRYFFRVVDLVRWLEQEWGPPDVTLKDGEIVETNPQIVGRQGILLFSPITGWEDAAGHATLYNGSGCYDACFFNPGPAGVYHTQQGKLWELPP